MLRVRFTADGFEKRVAVKLVKYSFDSDFARRRFEHERQILARLDHANIAPPGAACGLLAVRLSWTADVYAATDRRQQPSWSGQGDWSPDGKFIVIAATGDRAEHTQWKGVTADALAAALAAPKRK